MNSIWNNNIALFKKRFPQLAILIKKQIDTFSESDIFFWNIDKAKNGSVIVQENGLKLHSSYNPEREASSVISSAIQDNFNCKNIVFFGFGLGYSVIEATKEKKLLLIIEPNVNYFLAALYYLDWSSVFACENVVFAIGCPVEQTIKLINHFGVLDSVFINSKPQSNHEERYFSEIQTLIIRNKQKEEINKATTKKFAKRWNINCLKNSYSSTISDGIDIFKNKAENLPFTIIAAGPSLQNILPYLKEIQERSVIVCVDTSLKSCLLAGVQPDFIIISDPQYWAYRHISGLNSPESVLVASSDVYPSVFKFVCKKIVCFSSMLPIGKYFERKCSKKDSLGAGGSVASCAWNFSEYCGAKEIYTAGLDLSFPKKQTHIKGSTFEQNVHVSSSKILNAESLSMPILFSGNIEKAKNYLNEDIVTDQRMKMFAWWFESRLAECPATKTFSFSSEGLKIPGIEICDVKKILMLPKKEREKNLFFEKAEFSCKTENVLQIEKNLFKSAYKNIIEKLKDIDMSNFQVVKDIVDLL